MQLNDVTLTALFPVWRGSAGGILCVTRVGGPHFGRFRFRPGHVLAQTLSEGTTGTVKEDAHHDTETEWRLLVPYDGGCCSWSLYWLDFVSYSVGSDFRVERVKFPSCYRQSSTVRFQGY